MSLKDKIRDNYDDPDSADVSGSHTGGGTYYVKPGQYMAQIHPGTEYSDTKDGSGAYIRICYELASHDYDGRRHYETYMTDYQGDPDWLDGHIDRLLEVMQATGHTDTLDEAELADALVGERLLVTLTLEWDDYEDGDYVTALTGIDPVSDGPPAGPWPDDEQPEVWDKAQAYQGGDDSGPAESDDYGGTGSPDESYDEDEVPF